MMSVEQDYRDLSVDSVVPAKGQLVDGRVGHPSRRCPANIEHRPNVVLVLGRRRRRWTNIRSALG